MSIQKLGKSEDDPKSYHPIYRIKHNKTPVYLGIILDRILTQQHHLDKTASKLKTRTEIISKLARTTWGANTQILRTLTITLLYSVAEYCSLVWEGNIHCRLIDVELRKSLFNY